MIGLQDKLKGVPEDFTLLDTPFFYKIDALC